MVIGSIIGGVSQGYAADRAANAQMDAANLAAKTQMDIYNSNKGMLTPWNDRGFQAYSTLNDLLGVGGNSETMQKSLENLPGYQFTLNQGLKSLQNGAAARGLGSSGAALKGAAGYATGLANSQYGTYANQLMGSANMGLGAASAIAGVGQNTGAGVANSMIAGGNAAAAGWNGIGAAASNTAQNIGLYSALNKMNGGGQTSGPFNNFDLSMVP